MSLTMNEKSSVINIAYIDDEIDFLTISEKILLQMNNNYKIEVFQDPRAFLDCFKEKNSFFDIVISDYEMPEMNGLTLLSEIKKYSNFKRPPFIMVTGKGRNETIKKALNADVDYYIEKSSNIESLFSELDHFIHKAIEKNLIEKEIVELKSLYESLANLSPDGIFVMNKFNKIEFINQSFLDTLGYSDQSEIIGSSVVKLLDPKPWSITNKRLKKIEELKEIPFRKITALKKDGTRISAESTARLVYYKGQKATIVYVRNLKDN